jgi:rRNA maturation endonuclease Nob1
MSALTSSFITTARASTVNEEKPKVTYEGKSTFTMLCFGCWTPTPHYMDRDASVCILCGHKSNVTIRPDETSRLGG